MRTLRTPVVIALLLLTGCTAPPDGPEALNLDPDKYRAAFDAALVVANDHGLAASFRDRRGGIIETLPDQAATLLEPWRQHGASSGQVMENTIENQRRRARFEFVAVDTPAASATPPKPELLSDHEPVDLTTYDGPITMRVTVFVERHHRPHLRRSTWTRRKLTATDVVPSNVEPQGLPNTYWVTVARDEAFERRLLAAVETTLAP
jgi:hypothetical protein